MKTPYKHWLQQPWLKQLLRSQVNNIAPSDRKRRAALRHCLKHMITHNYQASHVSYCLKVKHSFIVRHKEIRGELWMMSKY